MLTELNALVHGSNDIRVGQGVVRISRSWSHHNPQGNVNVHCCGNSGQSADFIYLPVRGSVVDFFLSQLQRELCQKLQD